MGGGPQILRYVREALAESGCVPLVTGDDQELAHIMRSEKPALVLLDLMVSGTGGIVLMEHVPELADRPIIFIFLCGELHYGRAVAAQISCPIGHQPTSPLEEITPEICPLDSGDRVSKGGFR